MSLRLSLWKWKRRDTFEVQLRERIGSAGRLFVWKGGLEGSRMLFKLKSVPVGWRTVLLVEIRSRFDGQNRGSLFGGDQTGSNHRLLMGWWKRKKSEKKT